MKLTDTQLMLLSAASQREDGGLELLPNLKGGACQKVVGKLLREGLIEELMGEKKKSYDLLVWAMLARVELPPPFVKYVATRVLRNAERDTDNRDMMLVIAAEPPYPVAMLL